MVTVLHATWLVNSAAHMWGLKPYDTQIRPAENQWVAYVTFGEGYHNYHHSFPWDYATSEWAPIFNITKYFIEFMEKIGQAYDLKRATKDTVESMKHKTRIRIATLNAQKDDDSSIDSHVVY